MGIDLSNNGVTNNDVDDADSGPNSLLNFPVLTNVTQTGPDLDIDFAVDLPAGNYRIEFFENPTDSNLLGLGEGQTLLGAVTITTTGAAGYESFTRTLTSVMPSQIAGIAATATIERGGGSYGSTREFGPRFEGLGVLVVNTTSDTLDGDTSSILNLLGNRGADNVISLREAITAANNTLNSGSPDEIHFNIAGAGPHTIQPTSSLPDITEAIIIDGTTEPDFVGTPVVELNGSLAGLNGDGLRLVAGSDGSTIRGLAINGYLRDGLVIDQSDSNSIAGNYLGLDTDGTTTVGNFRGIYVNLGDNNTIGGITAADRNVISGNFNEGILLAFGSDNNVIEGNYVGTDSTGSLDRGNVFGIYVAGNANRIGGSSSGARNVVSGNDDSGIRVSNGDDNLIQGNYIGVDAWGAALPSTANGIVLSAGSAGNLIGGTAAGAGNTIANQTGVGITLASNTGNANAIVGNAIFSNGGIGIDLNSDGVTANDPGDSDVGANNRQNYPVITSAVTDGSDINLTGSLNGNSSTTYRVEFFANAMTDPSGFGEGERYLGFLDVTTDAGGNAVISTVLAAPVVAGETVSATATVNLGGGNYGDTSEFAAGVVAQSTPPMIDLDADDSAAPGGDYVTTFVEDGGAVVIADADATIVDPDSANLVSLTVTITNLLDGTAESLTANTTGTSITDSYDNMTGVLLLTGSDTLANYEQVLRTIAYNNTDQDPDTSSRLVEFVAHDGVNNSSVARTTIAMTAVNDAPGGSFVASQSTPEDTGLIFSTANGNAIVINDPDAGTNPVRILVTVSNGTLSLSGTTGLTMLQGDGAADAILEFAGSLANVNAALEGSQFDPAPDFVGIATIAGSVDDQGFSGAGGPLTAGGMRTINVTAVNDAPVNAVPASQMVAEEVPTLLSGISVNDVDAAGGNITTRLQVANGVLNLTLAGGATILAGANGTGDLTIQGTVADVNATLASLQYTGNTDVVGVAADSLTLTTSDQGNTGTGGALQDVDNVQIDITPVNDAPQANAETYGIAEDTPLNVNAASGVLANDGDVDGPSLTASLLTPATHGTVIVNADGSFSYTPDPNFNGADSYVYRVTDGMLTDTATVTVNVSAVNDIPQGAADSYSVDNVNALIVSAANGVLSNDTDVDGLNLTAILVSGPSSGSLSLNPDGSFAYVPNLNFSGEDSFTYVAHDGSVASLPVTVTITVAVAGGPGGGSAGDDDTSDGDEDDLPVGSDPGDGETDDTDKGDSDDNTNDDDEPIDTSDPSHSDNALNPSLPPGGDAKDDDAPLASGLLPGEEAALFVIESMQQDMKIAGNAMDQLGEIADRHRSSRVHTGDEHVGNLSGLTGLQSLDEASAFVTHSGALWDRLDALKQDVEDDQEMEELIAGTTQAVTVALTSGYVLWTLRASYLIGGMLSSLPVWKTIDPLPVLDYESANKRGGDDESLEDVAASGTRSDRQQLDKDEETNASPTP